MSICPFPGIWSILCPYLGALKGYDCEISVLYSGLPEQEQNVRNGRVDALRCRALPTHTWPTAHHTGKHSKPSDVEQPPCFLGTGYFGLGPAPQFYPSLLQVPVIYLSGAVGFPEHPFSILKCMKKRGRSPAPERPTGRAFSWSYLLTFHCLKQSCGPVQHK